MKRRQFVIFLCAVFCKGPFAITDHTINSMLLEQPSAWPFAPTLDRLTAAIESAGLKVFARIDHAAGAKIDGAKKSKRLGSNGTYLSLVPYEFGLA